MHNAYMQALVCLAYLVHTRHQSRNHYDDCMYLASYDTHTSRRDHMYMTRCSSRMQSRSRTRSLGTWESRR